MGGGEKDRHQDRRRVAALVALPALCLVVGLAAWWLGAGATQVGRPATIDDATTVEMRSRIDAAMEDALPSSTEGFLADLARHADAAASAGAASGEDAEEAEEAAAGADAEEAAAAGGALAVVWEVAEPVDALATSVLEAYRATASTRLATSGYLDLKGNVWGAVVQGGGDWVDVVVIAASGEEDEDDEATARVVRLVAPAS